MRWVVGERKLGNRLPIKSVVSHGATDSEQASDKADPKVFRRNLVNNATEILQLCRFATEPQVPPHI